MEHRQTEVSDGTQRIHTHYIDQGGDHRGAPVVILHGGLEGGEAWNDMAAALAKTHRVLRPDRRGHGGTPDVDGPYRYEAMARETAAFLDQVVGEPAHLVGYSDGGACALSVAVERPELVKSLVVIGAHYHHDGILESMRERFRHPEPHNERLAPMREAHDATSPDGAGSFARLFVKVCDMALSGPTLTPADVSRIVQPCLVVVGDDDVIDHRHTVSLYEALPDGRLAIVPGTSHVLPHEAPELLLSMVQGLIDGRPLTRSMPMRQKKQAGAGP